MCWLYNSLNPQPSASYFVGCVICRVADLEGQLAKASSAVTDLEEEVSGLLMSCVLVQGASLNTTHAQL